MNTRLDSTTLRSVPNTVPSTSSKPMDLFAALIVHRTGIVDEEYNRRTCANCSIGTTLELDDRAGRIRTN